MSPRRGGRGARGWSETRRGGAGLRSEGSFFLSSQVSPEMGLKRRGPGAQFFSAQRGIWGRGGNLGLTPGPRRISGRAAGGGRGSRGVPGLCVAASLSYPLPLPLCAQTLFFVVVVRGELNPRLGSGLLEGAQVPGLKLCRLF